MKKLVVVLICVSMSFLSFTEKEGTIFQDKNIVEIVDLLPKIHQTLFDRSLVNFH